MKVIYGKDAQRIDLTHEANELSWSSSRGQLSRVCDVQINNAPNIEKAGFLMLFTGELKEREQIFHGPIVNFARDDRSNRLTATAYEISWYLQKNETTQIIRVNGDAGKELERIIKAAGVNFSCPPFKVTIKDRVPVQSYASLFTWFTEQAYEKTGWRYFLEHRRDKLYVLPEGQNSFVPLFRPSQMESSSRGESIEEVYTVVTAQRYKEDKIVGSVTKENTSLRNQIGRMQKTIDAGEDKNLADLAANQLGKLSKVPKTRSITVKHTDNGAAKTRAGWLIKTLEKDNKTITDWIVTSCNARWKGGLYTMDLQLERR